MGFYLVRSGCSEGTRPVKLIHLLRISPTIAAYSILSLVELISVGESWGMANDGEWRTGQYLVEGVNAINFFHPMMLIPLMARVNSN